MGLVEILTKNVKDPRRAQGMRHNLGQIFSMIIIGNLCGHLGGRAVEKFGKLHQGTFTQYLGLKHPVPSHVTFSDLLNRTDEQQLISAFNEWAGDFVDLQKGDFVSGDGKVLGSTVSDCHGKQQNFQSVVSLFCQKTGLVHSLQEFQNNKSNEIDVVRFLIERLEVKGMIFF